MTEIRKYGVHLRRIGKEDLELIRSWRNAPRVRLAMEYQEEISSEMQEKWFNSLNTNRDFYFLYSATGKKPSGVVNVKNAESESAIGEAGIFSGEPEGTFSDLSVRATLCMMDFAFFELRLNFLRAKIRVSNKLAMEFNRKLGYEPESESDAGSEFRYFRVSHQRFLEVTIPLRTWASRI